jgi:hypothetical protein
VRRVVRPPQPHRVDLHEAAEGGADGGHHEEQTGGLAGVRREETSADDVVLGPPRAGELGALLPRSEYQVDGDQREHECRDQQHVEDVEPADDHLAGKVAAEQCEVRPRPDQWDGQDDRADDPEAGTRQQVVQHRVAGHPVEERQGEEPDADDPGASARPAEGAGEEAAQQVQDDRGDEQQGRPVVDLPHEQTAANVERQVQCRVVGRRHLDAAQGRVGPLVRDLAHGGVEEEHQVDARQEQDDERGDGDLPEHERPMVGVHLVQRPAQPVPRDESVVGLSGRLADRGRRHPLLATDAPHGHSLPDPGIASTPVTKQLPGL